MICNIPIIPCSEDLIKWKLTHHGQFSTSSAWEYIRQQKNTQPIMKDVWNPCLIPTISVFAWRVLQNWIPVDFRIQRKGIQLASQCQCCKQVETQEHLFLLSEKSQLVWRHFADLFNLQIPQTANICHMVQAWKFSTAFDHASHIRLVLPILILWFIWTERNDSKHRHMGFQSKRVIWRIHNYLWCLHVSKELGPKQWRGDMHVAAKLGFQISHLKQEKNIVIVRWIKPRGHGMKLNTDGASKGSTGLAGAGGIIRDARGHTIVAFQEFLGLATNTFAEISAVAKGLEIAHNMGLNDIGWKWILRWDFCLFSRKTLVTGKSNTSWLRFAIYALCFVYLFHISFGKEILLPTTLPTKQ
ncbi:UNVERIFIED_CONTAM: hypothetical protein Sradi_6441000 [Sesamum radiatum]|uniref:RNase H type-1 domain-containing protein n=1 Tax=Sesamum radiatum TaxID=300843 RepID=A0AAW2K629_SESRA